MSKDPRAEGTILGEVYLTGSSTWARTGGYFVDINSSGTADMSVAADSKCSGWVCIGFDQENSAYSASTDILTVPATTTDRYKFSFIPGHQLKWARLPVYGATLAATHGGGSYDFYVASSKQYVNLGGTTYGVLTVLPPSAEDIADQMARVFITPSDVLRD